MYSGFHQTFFFIERPKRPSRHYLKGKIISKDGLGNLNHYD
jgi:hypothetical protein